MSKDWTTQAKDMLIAQLVMEDYASKKQIDVLGLFELVVNQPEKRMDFRLAHWVCVLIKQFNTMYGTNHGEYVSRHVITRCMTQGQTLH